MIKAKKERKIDGVTRKNKERENNDRYRTKALPKSYRYKKKIT